VPVVLYDDEPPRTSWGDILALGERLGGRASLVPADHEARVRMLGLLHEVAGEGGLGWNARLIMIHGSLSTDGARSFPLPVAQYLAAKYGYSPERAAAAPARVRDVVALCELQLARSRAAGHAYFFGDSLGAMDIFVAAFLTPVLCTDADCPGMRPEIRPAFTYLAEQVGAEVPASLAAHRALIYREHLPWPIPL
jgi:glutathione S-transferase